MLFTCRYEMRSTFFCGKILQAGACDCLREQFAPAVGGLQCHLRLLRWSFSCLERMSCRDFVASFWNAWNTKVLKKWNICNAIDESLGCSRKTKHSNFGTPECSRCSKCSRPSSYSKCYISWGVPGIPSIVACSRCPRCSESIPKLKLSLYTLKGFCLSLMSCDYIILNSIEKQRQRNKNKIHQKGTFVTHPTNISKEMDSWVMEELGPRGSHTDNQWNKLLFRLQLGLRTHVE